MSLLNSYSVSLGSEIKATFQSPVANLVLVWFFCLCDCFGSFVCLFFFLRSLAPWWLLGKWSLAVISCPSCVVAFLRSFN